MNPKNHVQPAKTILIWAGIFFLAVISSCSIEKQYHSWGYKISPKDIHVGINNTKVETSKKNSSNQRNPFKSLKLQDKSNHPNSTAVSGNAINQTNLHEFGMDLSKIGIEITDPLTWNHKALNHRGAWNKFGPSEKFSPTDTVFFPEKYQHRKHGTLYLPQIKNEEEFNNQTKLANYKDVTAWNWFDRGHRSSKMALYWLFFLIAIIIVIGLGNISLAGIATATRKSITIALLLVPALMFTVGYLCYLMGTFSIWSANKLYKEAVFKLPYDLKLRGDAIIMHARIPYVSKGATLRTAKRILSSYPNDRNGEWLEDVSKTRQELLSGRTSLTINNWSRMRTIGFITTLIILGIIAALIL